MKRKIYKILSCANQILFALALAILPGTAYSQTTYTFNYTGGSQTLSLPAGSYSIALWGATGGTVAANTATPGTGGYSSGNITLNATTTFSIYVGGKGNGGAQPLGGFNSGNTTTKTNTATATGGGGASDVRVLVDDYYHRIIVAGGGGGQGTSTGTGGHGGGLTGQNGQGTTNAGVGGSQTAAGLYPGGSDAKPAAFGEGGDGPSGTTGGQGGGGWYGGSFGTRTNGGGAGGSGYVLTSSSYTPTGYFSAHPNYYFTNTVTAMPGATGFVTNPVTTGNGLVLITELCNMTLYAAGTTNSLNPSMCAGQSATLMTNAISNYSWSTGATTSSLVISPTSNTVYAITATAPASCTATRSISITVSSGTPVLSVSQSTTSTCLGNTVSVNATGAITYTWSNSLQNNVAFTPSSGTNVYTVTGQNACGTSTALATISVSALPVIGVASPSVVCENNVTTLTVTGASTYTWMPMNQTGTMVVATATAPTVFTVMGESGNCAGTHTVQVNTNPNPTLTIVGTGSLPCIGAPVTLTVGGAVTYTWVQTNLSGTLVTDTPSVPILYQVSGTNSVGCVTGTNYVVVPQSAPVLTSNFTSSTICKGSSVALLAGGGNSYTWSTGSNANPLVLSPAGNTVISVIGGHNTNTCTTSQSYSVVVAVPVLPVSQSTAICEGGVTTLTAGAGQNYVWYPVGSQFPVLTDISPSVTTIYTVTADVTVLNINCPASNTVMVTVNPNPTINVTPVNAVICRKDPIVLTASGAGTYAWFNQATGSSITYTTNIAGMFTNTVVGTDQNGCSTEASFSFSVSNCNGITELSGAGSVLVYPNPSRGEITIRADKPVTLHMVNALGQNMKSIVIRNAEQVETVSGLAEGVYFITAEGDNSVRETVIIQR